MRWIFWLACALLAPVLTIVLQRALTFVFKVLRRVVRDAGVVGLAAFFAALAVSSAIGVLAPGLEVSKWPPLVIWLLIQVSLDLKLTLEASRSEPDYGGEASSPTGLHITMTLAHIAGLIAGQTRF